MAITVTQHQHNDSILSATTVAVTVSALGTGNLLVVGCGNNGTRTVSGVSDGANTYLQGPTCAASANTSADNTDIWYCLSSASGPTTVTVTFTGVAGTFAKDAEVWEVHGFTTAGLDVHGIVNNTQQTNQLDNGASVTTTSTVGFIAACCHTSTSGGGSISLNPNTGNEFSSGGDISGTLFGAVSLISTTAAAHQAVWGDGNSFLNYCNSTLAFKETASGDNQEWLTRSIQTSHLTQRNVGY